MNRTYIVYAAIAVILIIVVSYFLYKEKFVNIIPATSTGGCGNTGNSGCMPVVNSDASSTKSFSTTDQKFALVADASGNLSTGTTVPIGSVVMWAGTATPPSGWKICDGSTDAATGITTPDLRGRFVIGANPASTPPTNVSQSLSTYAVGDYGGEELHYLTVSELATHAHLTIKNINAPNADQACLGTGNNLYSGGGGADNFGYGGGSDGSGCFITGPAGASQGHNNVPPFYALVYIMRIF
jgi:microcystin-dependent protein